MTGVTSWLYVRNATLKLLHVKADAGSDDGKQGARKSLHRAGRAAGVGYRVKNRAFKLGIYPQFQGRRWRLWQTATEARGLARARRKKRCRIKSWKATPHDDMMEKLLSARRGG